MLPWAIFIGYSVLVYAAAIGESGVPQMDAVAGRWHYWQFKRIEDYLTIGINTVLAGLIWSRVSRYYARIEHWLPERFADLLRLLKTVMALALVTAVVNLVSFSAEHLLGLGDRGVFSHAAQAFYVVLVYTVGIVGFRLKDLPQFPEATTEPAPPALPARPDPGTDDAFQKLQALMQTTQLFADPDLNLNTVAQRLGLTATETSRVIKEGSGKHFRAYVNEFRVEAVKRKLLDPDYRSVSVLAISLECGFNAESSFYRVFKAATGLSPTSSSRSQAPVRWPRCLRRTAP
ncbi:helix-turn-helix domain-containing protein [Tahibacter amnicola]|uniref:Helix-turn-helix domain-containing protein n=1 Tax=Tahibacter amnicola TaxID=2976241 RepID=A0ABY6B7F5_9GAMM|nr:helix-turn-helix domain-containing protein [Tahibacter amnicola]UXI66033.1 helix-turn-helix domain-containing protein [Tahibacter amnicola]